MRGDQASCLGEGEAGALQRRWESSGSLGGDETEAHKPEARVCPVPPPGFTHGIWSYLA